MSAKKTATRRQHLGWIRWTVGLAVTVSGCDGWWFDYTGDCELMLTCEKYRGRGNGVTPADCMPSTNAEPVDDTCGVFVSASGDDASAGTKDAPVKTLAAALTAAERGESRRVYACAETFDENLEVTGSATIFGALDCANGWAWAGTTRKTTLTAAEGTIPLVVRGGDASANVIVRVEDVAVTARGISALEQAKRGLSSIAAVAENVTLELARCALEAGDGATGVDGAPTETSIPASSDGNSGGEACSVNQVVGGDEALNDCGTPDDPSDDSIGASGGNGQQNSGGNGSDGTPGALLNAGTGERDMVLCTNGTDGDSGTPGEPGAGASGLGEISAAGYTGPLGTNGTKGKTAQGGGGGGGAKGGTGATKCETATSAGGASGGSGGAGGCGGAGGKGGGAGGASIALLSLNAQLHFDTVTLKTGRGGAGGQGGEGQTGGRGGGPGGALPAGATGLHAGCAGGNGGDGGNGGRGGGGLGGPSIGIAFRDAAPALQGATITTGEAGTGGIGAGTDHSGAVGVKADVQEF